MFFNKFSSRNSSFAELIRILHLIFHHNLFFFFESSTNKRKHFQKQINEFVNVCEDQEMFNNTFTNDMEFQVQAKF